MSRKGARECAMKMLYEYSITSELNNPFEDEEKADLYDQPLDEEGLQYVGAVQASFLERREEIDNIITLHSHAWRIERISKVDLAILRLALFEMRYLQTPPKVAVNEAVELAKKYSSDQSYKYVNGLLGGYLNSQVE